MSGDLVTLGKVYLAVFGILIVLGTYYSWATWRDQRRSRAMVVVEWDVVREAEAILKETA